MRVLIGLIPLLACGCSTAPIAGLMDWCKPSKGGAPVGPIPPVPPAAQVPPPTTASPGVFDPTRLRRTEPATPGIPATSRPDVTPPPVISSGPANAGSDPVLLPPPSFPGGR